MSHGLNVDGHLGEKETTYVPESGFSLALLSNNISILPWIDEYEYPLQTDKLWVSLLTFLNIVSSDFFLCVFFGLILVTLCWIIVLQTLGSC